VGRIYASWANERKLQRPIWLRLEEVSCATVAHKKKVRFCDDQMAPFLVNTSPRGQGSNPGSATPGRSPPTAMRQEIDNGRNTLARAVRDPRRLVFSQEDEPMYTPRDQSPRNWEEFSARQREAHRAHYQESPTSRHHTRRGMDGMDADMQTHMAPPMNSLTHQVTLESLAVMMSQLMLQLNELSLRMGGTDQLISKYEQILAGHQESLDRLQQEFTSYKNTSTPPTRASSVGTYSTARGDEYDRSSIVAFSLDGRLIADDEFFTQLLQHVAMQPGDATYTSLAGGRGMKVQFNSVSEAVEVLKRRREILDLAKVRVDEDLPPQLRRIRALNRPIFRYLLEVKAEPNKWYRMRGGKIQVNDTFQQGQDGQGNSILLDRGAWRDFDAQAYADEVKNVQNIDILAWWRERRDQRATAATSAPGERSAHQG